MSKPRYFVALPGGASHVATICGAAMALRDACEVPGWSGVSAGFLVALLAAFGALDRAPALMTEMLQHNRVLDIKPPDGNLGLCAWHVIPELVDHVLGKNVEMGEAVSALVGVATNADTAEPMYFSKAHTPRVLCRDVARATSALVPLASMVMVPSLGTALSPDIRMFYDGGFTDNLPDHVFDGSLEPTIAVRLHAGTEIVRVSTFDRDPGAALKQALAVVRAVTFAQSQRKSARRDVDGRVCDLHPVGSGLDFDLTPAVTAARVAQGRVDAVTMLAMMAAS